MDTLKEFLKKWKLEHLFAIFEGKRHLPNAPV